MKTYLDESILEVERLSIKLKRLIGQIENKICDGIKDSKETINIKINFSTLINNYEDTLGYLSEDISKYLTEFKMIIKY